MWALNAVPWAANQGRQEPKRTRMRKKRRSPLYVPTAISLFLLLAGILLDFLDTPWFTGYVRLLVYGIAYVLVGWRVVWHAIKA